MSVDRAMHYFMMLSRDEQRDAVGRLSRQGMPDHIIAATTGLSVALIRRIISENRESLSGEATPQ